MLNLSSFLDYIFPREGFGNIHTYFSDAIILSQRSKLKPLNKEQRKHLSGIFIASDYHNEYVHTLINRIKSSLEWDISYDLAYLIYQKIWIECEYFIPNPDFIVPIPPDPVRYKLRGFHLPNLLSDHLSSLVNVESVSLLTKKHSPKQTNMRKTQRLTNVINNFDIIPNIGVKMSESEIIWLIDDLSTTGSTFNECARLIKKSYPHLKIYGVAVSGN